MTRQGLQPEQILEAINQLDAEGVDVTVTAVRERLGSGSYSTIGAVLNDWRTERKTGARSNAPPPPAQLRGLLHQLWAESWRAADAHYDAERVVHAQERVLFQKTRDEMTAEIVRLEADNGRERQEKRVAQSRLAAADQELQAAQAELARSEKASKRLESEADRLRHEAQKAVDTMTPWVERATRAETRLEELERVGPTPRPTE